MNGKNTTILGIITRFGNELNEEMANSDIIVTLKPDVYVEAMIQLKEKDFYYYNEPIEKSTSFKYAAMGKNSDFSIIVQKEIVND